jgi:triosephosphate isomerase
MSEFMKGYEPKPNIKAIICPPNLIVTAVADYTKTNNINVETGVQDVSKYEEGAHTGEVSAKTAAEFAKYSIIGHSERRANGESDNDVKKKTEQALKFGIIPIVCVVNENVPVPEGVMIVAYEPVEAIGTGHPDTPENADRVALLLKSSHSGIKKVLYGGSVTADNVDKFVKMENIDGVLVGGASLDPEHFLGIIRAC